MMNAVVLPTESTNKEHTLRVVFSHQIDEYAQLGAFIKKAYRQRYAAKNPHLLPILVALETSDGELVAACGLSVGTDHRFFLEQYLDDAIENIIANRQQRTVPQRRQIVEVGNLCSTIPSGGRLMIASLCRWFYETGFQWVVFTGTTQLRNSFARLGIKLFVVAKADPSRLKNGVDGWGHYYQTQPQVMAGDIRTNYARLQFANKQSSSKNVLPLHLDVILNDAAD